MYNRITLVVLLVLLSACSVVDERRDAYKEAGLMQPLEVPPDLLRIDAPDELSAAVAPMGTSVTLSEFSKAEAEASAQAQAQAQTQTQARPQAGLQRGEAIVADANVGLVLNSDKVKLVRDGGRYWLEVPGQPALAWPIVKKFWQSREIVIEKEMPKLGLMHTAWIEDKSKLPETSLFEKAFSKLRSSNLRDQYLVRIEPATIGDSTEVHIVHRGLTHEIVGENLRWLPRPRDTELEIEMLKRLALFVGLGEDQATQMLAVSETVAEKVTLETSEDGALRLKLALGFAQAWREVGDELLISGMDIEDFNRSKGEYFVLGNLLTEITSKADIFERLTTRQRGEVKPFLVRLVEVEGAVLVSVEGRDGSEITKEETEHFLSKMEKALD